MLLDSMTAAKVERSLPSTNSLGALAGFFDALSDVTRLKLVSALAVSPMCVTDLASLTSVNQTTVSHQLKILRGARIVQCTRQGKVMFYSLAESTIPRIMGAAVDVITVG